jgi:hypothetical protein
MRRIVIAAVLALACASGEDVAPPASWSCEPGEPVSCLDADSIAPWGTFVRCTWECASVDGASGRATVLARTSLDGARCETSVSVEPVEGCP